MSSYPTITEGLLLAKDCLSFGFVSTLAKEKKKLSLRGNKRLCTLVYCVHHQIFRSFSSFFGEREKQKNLHM